MDGCCRGGNRVNKVFFIPCPWKEMANVKKTAFTVEMPRELANRLEL